jgi:hypothetical protein
MEFVEQAERLKSLAKELTLGAAESAVLSAALDLAEGLAQRVHAMEEEFAALTEQVDDLEDALDEMGEDLYGEEGDETFEVECPNCGELIQIDEGILEEGSIACPGCDETLEFEFGCDCDDCDCENCGHEHD